MTHHYELGLQTGAHCIDCPPALAVARQNTFRKVYGYALYKNGRYACIKYPMEGYSADVAGRSFHHGRFIQRLRHAAAGVPTVTVREGNVRRLMNGAFRASGEGVHIQVAAVGSWLSCRCRLCREKGHLHFVLGGTGWQLCRGLIRNDSQVLVSAAAGAAAGGCSPRTVDQGLDWSEGEPVSGVQYKTGDGEVRTAKAHLTVVCDGMYSQFRCVEEQRETQWERLQSWRA